MWERSLYFRPELRLFGGDRPSQADSPKIVPIPPKDAEDMFLSQHVRMGKSH